MKHRLFIFLLIVLLSITLPLIAQDTSTAEPVPATAQAMVINGQATLDALSILDSTATQQSIEAISTPVSESVSVTTNTDLNLSELAFLSNRNGTYLIYVREVEDTTLSDSELLPLNEGYGLSRLSWFNNSYSGRGDGGFTGSISYSPDGNKIIFASDVENNLDIYIIDLISSLVDRITFEAVAEFNPIFSDIGDQIAYVNGYTGRGALFTADIEGGASNDLTGSNGYSGLPSWYNNEILFTSDRSSYSQLYRINLVNGTLFRYSTQYVDYQGQFSPDGTKIAFVSNRSGDRNIFIMDYDGNNVQQLTFDTAIDIFPSWSPDSQSIAFVSDRDGDREIFIMNVDGSNVRQLTNNDFDDIYPIWRAIGNNVEFVEFEEDFPLFVEFPNAGVVYAGRSLDISWESRELESDERFSINIWTQRQVPEYYSVCAPFSATRDSREMEVNMFNLRWQWNGCPAIFSDDPTAPPAAERNFKIQIFIINVNNGRVIDESAIIDFEWNTGG